MGEPDSHALARRSALVFIGDLLGALSGYGALFAITRYIRDPAALGAYSYALSLTVITTLVANMGLRQSHTHHIAQGLSVRRALGTYLPPRFGRTIGMAALWLAGYSAWTTVDPHALRDTTFQILALSLTLHVVTSFRAVAFDTWAAQFQIQRAQLAQLLENALILVLVTVVSLAVAGSTGRWTPLNAGDTLAPLLGLDQAVSAIEAGTLLASAYLVAKIASVVPVMVWWLRDRTPVGRFDRETARGYLRYGWPLAPQSVLLLAIAHTDILAVGFFATPTQVGWYDAAYKLSNIANLLALSIGMLLFPLLSSLHGQGKKLAAMRAFTRAERILLLLSLPVVAAMIALPREGIHIFLGDGFLGAAVPLQLLAAATLFLLLSKPLRVKFLGAGMPRMNLQSSLVHVALNVVLDVLLVPTSILGVPLAGMGVAGAATATLLSTAIAYLYLRIQAHRHLEVPLFDSHLLRLVLAGTVAWGTWAAAGRWLPASLFDRVWELLAWGVVGTLVYLGATVALRALPKEDVALLRRTANPRKLWHELRGR